MTDTPPCCAASREENSCSTDSRAQVGTSAAPTKTNTSGMVHLEGDSFSMGTDSDEGFPEDGEGPVREVTVDPFYIDKFVVTNAQFLEFVRETDYTTDAERYGWSFVFKNFVDESDHQYVLSNVAEAPWWVAVRGATWLRPTAPSSNIINEEQLRHPVTHVSWRDAAAYADWAGKRLPTEAEWGYAARGGLEQNRFPWGNKFTPNGEHQCNTWQGAFPDHNTVEDGFAGTAPVNAFDPNGYGLYNTAGNVWEWCADWFSSEYHATTAYDWDNPTGPPNGKQRVMRGGSYLCHHSWCNRYRVAARSKSTPDSSTGNIGFRCVVDEDEN